MSRPYYTRDEMDAMRCAERLEGLVYDYCRNRRTLCCISGAIETNKKYLLRNMLSEQEPVIVARRLANSAGAEFLDLESPEMQSVWLSRLVPSTLQVCIFDMDFIEGRRSFIIWVNRRMCDDLSVPWDAARAQLEKEILRFQDYLFLEAGAARGP